MSPTQLCPSPETLKTLIDGRVDEPDLSLLTAHLEECSSCQVQAQSLLSSDTLVDSLRGEPSETEQITATIPTKLIESLKLIPNLDSQENASSDGLARDQTLSLDDLGNDLGLSFLQPASEPDEIGRLGHYRVLQVLGRGGMGAVFLAEDPKLGRRVAIKVMLPKIASIQAARNRFLREAKAAASLKNDHIVTVYQVDEYNGVPFLAMELLQGESLEHAIQSGRRFSITETIHIARDVTRGLVVAHEKALVHRDIKPGNIWLEQLPDSGTRVKVLDFGLARTEVDEVHITEFGTIVGTPAFMAPEQARADRPIDARADLFSLGCVLYLMCTGEVPFKADTIVGTLMALAMSTPVAPNQRNQSVPKELSNLVMQLLEKDPAQRPQSARDLLERLRLIERSIDATQTPTGVFGATLLGLSKPIMVSSDSVATATQPARKPVGRGPKIATGFFIAAILLFAAGVYFWQTPRGQIVRIENVTESAIERLHVAVPEFQIEYGANDVPVVLNSKDMTDSKPSSSASDQFAMLIEPLKRANPSFDGALAPTFQGGMLVGLSIRTDNVSDISALKALKHLRSLRLMGNFSRDAGVSDLSPLKGLPLTELYVDGNARLSDLSPLRGMGLQQFFAQGTQISDLSPLEGSPLQKVGLWGWAGSDISPLKGMPLTDLNIGGNGKEMDLTPLTGAPIEFLCLNSSNVSDITPLKGMPLKTLMCENTLVSDIRPLRGSKLEVFIGGGSRVTDFSVLRGMPLQWIKHDIILERDLEMLREFKHLERINNQRAVDFLRELSDDPQPQPPHLAFKNSMGMEFVRVPKGKAWLFRKVSETETTANHESVIEDDFYLGMYEVTQDQWVKVMGSNPSWFTRNADGADEVKILPDEVLKRLPVERVSWTDCQTFIKKLNELDTTPGWVYRLPTEQEWQYACRGGAMVDESESRFEYYSTVPMDQLTLDQANVSYELGWNRPCRVGMFQPNALGLYDMQGNVWEWCEDAPPWRATPSRFIHGGCWREPAAECRVSNIKVPTEPWTYYDLGLRVARVPIKQ